MEGQRAYLQEFTGSKHKRLTVFKSWKNCLLKQSCPYYVDLRNRNKEVDALYRKIAFQSHIRKSFLRNGTSRPLNNAQIKGTDPSHSQKPRWNLVPSVFPCSSVGNVSACNAGDLGSVPGSGSSPGEGNGNPFQYSCLENPMDRGAWRATVHGNARVGYDLVLSFFSFFLFCIHSASELMGSTHHGG